MKQGNVEEKVFNQIESLIKEAMEEVNKELKLNVTINCSTAFGNNYADIH